MGAIFITPAASSKRLRALSAAFIARACLGLPEIAKILHGLRFVTKGLVLEHCARFGWVPILMVLYIHRKVREKLTHEKYSRTRGDWQQAGRFALSLLYQFSYSDCNFSQYRPYKNWKVFSFIILINRSSWWKKIKIELNEILSHKYITLNLILLRLNTEQKLKIFVNFKISSRWFLFKGCASCNTWV